MTKMLQRPERQELPGMKTVRKKDNELKLEVCWRLGCRVREELEKQGVMEATVNCRWIRGRSRWTGRQVYGWQMKQAVSTAGTKMS